jgi:hypothetical protein
MGIDLVMEFICLLCFHRWQERMDVAKERQCSRCKSRAVVEYQQFQSAVDGIRLIVNSSERPFVSISKAVEIMSPLTSLVRPGPLRVIRLWKKILLEAGVRENELNMYLRA